MIFNKKTLVFGDACVWPTHVRPPRFKRLLEMWKTNINENITKFDLELSVIKYYDITNKVKSTKSFHYPS